MVEVRYPLNWGLKLELVENAANEALNYFGLGKEVVLSIYFVGRKKAKELNVKYRQMNYVPQVLGFPMNREKDAEGKIRLGDIVICTQKLKYEAKYQKKSVEEVLNEWMRHGVENLLK